VPGGQFDGVGVHLVFFAHQVVDTLNPGLVATLVRATIRGADPDF
jgi:hypothetical protein